MASQKLLDIPTRMWGLFETVREGAEYLAEHPQNQQMQADVAAGLRALQTYLEGGCQSQEGGLSQPEKDTAAAFRLLAGRLDNDGAWDAACAHQLAKGGASLAEALSLGLIEAIRADGCLSKEQAQPLFAFCSRAPHTCAAIYQLIFELCKRTAVSMPQESYDWTICALEEHPELLSGEGKAHPDYHYRTAPQRVFERCPVCHNAGKPYYRAFSYQMSHFDYPHLPAKLWMKCGGCGNLYTWKYPEELLTQAIHPELVQPNASRALTAIRPTSGSVLSIWSAILNKLHTYTDGKDLLEVGIGEGCLLAVALEMGYRPDAVEIVRQSAQEVADILQIPIWNGDFLDYHPEKRYSVIIMGDVIEHVTDPERALRNAHSLLAEDGVLWLSTPNFESSFTRMLKFSDPMWMEPYHITYFNFEGLRALAQTCGFAVREYQVSNRYNGSMELILTKNDKGPNPIGPLP